MLTQSNIDQIIKTIVDGYFPDKIILFGSYAQGNPTDESDIDLLIVKQTNEKPSRRSRQVRYLFDKQDFAMDVLVFTPEEVKNLGVNKNNIVTIALREGISVYERAS